jgi:hypothetical protein
LILAVNGVCAGSGMKAVPMADVLGADFGHLAEAHKLYTCHDFIVQHNSALFDHPPSVGRICSTGNSMCCFRILRSSLSGGDKRKHGYLQAIGPLVLPGSLLTPNG